jgi:hypothetical protein
MGRAGARRPGKPRKHDSSSGLAGVVAVFVVLVAVVSRDAPAGIQVAPRTGEDTPLERASGAPGVAGGADELPPLDVVSASTKASVRIRLYAPDGAIDIEARDAFERVASGDGAPHPLATRVEQLVLMAAYHFARAPVFIVSAWREHASRHGTGEAIDFRLKGVRAARLAGYLRGLSRVGVGIYTHPRTQFVHLDVRDQSYHWIDASPPGVHWQEAQLRDPRAALRDAAWVPDMDLPE